MSTKRYGYCYNNKGILRFSWVIINYFAHFFLEQGWIFNFVMEFAAHQSYFFGKTRLWMWIFKKSSRKGRRKEIEDEQRNLFKRIPRQIPFLHQILLVDQIFEMFNLWVNFCPKWFDFLESRTQTLFLAREATLVLSSRTNYYRKIHLLFLSFLS